MNRLFLSILLLTVVMACKNDASQKEEQHDPVLEKIGGKNYKDIIRIPIDDTGELDTNNIAKISFEQMVYDMGDIVQGTEKSFQIPFKSVGKSDLYILSGESSCGCTVAAYPEEAIPPGTENSLEITFDSENRPLGPSTKYILLKTNTYPNTHEIKLTVNIIE